METVQRCRRCGQDLPLEAFSPSKHGKNGVWCRSCHSTYNRERGYTRRPSSNCASCAVCGKTMPSSVLPQGEATCLPCRQARAAERKSAPRPPRTCPICRRLFEHNRRTYCSLFCKHIGARIGMLRTFLRMEGEYRSARWWTTAGGPSLVIGPPPPPGTIDVWTTPTGDVRCPDCTDSMDDAGPLGHECPWCGIRVIFL